MSMWDDEAGYDRTDPKHPDWHGTTAGVWDNRDKAVGTKRPWFKQADGEVGADPVAFWPPRS